MKKIVLMASLAALPLGLAGCDKKTEAPKAEASADAMGDMAMPAEVKHGKGTGTVTAIDPAKGTVALDHGEIAELQWPAMKMGFAAKPEVLKDVKVGDKVQFEIDWDGKAGTVTAIGMEP
ncbi:MAG: copper-binding protein [Sphingomonadaceae bacterium]|nr:copper-binding protein [Sphingomonadaceae bacterium]